MLKSYTHAQTAGGRAIMRFKMRPMRKVCYFIYAEIDHVFTIIKVNIYDIHLTKRVTHNCLYSGEPSL